MGFTRGFDAAAPAPFVHLHKAGRPLPGCIVEGMRRALPLIVVAALLGACADPQSPSGGPNAGEPAATRLPTDRFELPKSDLAGYRAILASLVGKPVVANVWGSWCPPCREEAPALAEISKEFEGRVQFLGIDILDERGAARDFIREFDWPYPHLFDPTGAIRDGLGYIGQPITIIHDATGAKVFEWTGSVTAAQLRKELQKLV